MKVGEVRVPPRTIIGRVRAPIQPPTSRIRLPASHPYYTVQRYNAKHGTSFVYWPGGDAAPADWDGGPCLLNDGMPPALTVDDWGNPCIHGDDFRIVGYTRRAEPETATYDPRNPCCREADDGG